MTEKHQRRVNQWPCLTSSRAIGKTVASMMRALLQGLAIAHRERVSRSLTTSQTDCGIADLAAQASGAGAPAASATPARPAEKKAT